MKICNQCERINADRAQFCCKCGAPLGASQHGGQQRGYQTQQGYQSMNRSSNDTMGFGDAIRVCLQEKYASFDGRATRAEYWFFILFSILILFGATIVGAILGTVFSGGDDDVAVGLAIIVYSIVTLGIICPCISVLVRRLHDTGKSGWWYWIVLIPYLGGIIIFIFTLLESQKRDNEYGLYVRY